MVLRKRFLKVSQFSSKNNFLSVYSKFLCLFMCLSLPASICLNASLQRSISVLLSVRHLFSRPAFVHLSICKLKLLPACLSVCLTVLPSINFVSEHPQFRPSVHLSSYLLINLFVSPFSVNFYFCMSYCL